MNTKKIETYVRKLGVHVLMAVAGLVLLVNPDGATAFLTKLMGWVLVGYGAGKLMIPVTNHRPVSSGDWIWNGMAIVAGVILLARPLILADLIGRVLGVMILVEGLRSFRDGVDGKDILAVIGGVILVMLPRTLTNTVLALVGAALLVMGILNIIRRIKHIQRLEQGETPKIIDAL